MNVIDFHSHVLPQVDDGSASVEESVAMLRAEAAQGIQAVVATPHFYAHNDSPERFFARRDAAFRSLMATVAAESNLPAVRLGAEVYYFSGISHSEILSDLTVDGSHFILVEMPMSPWTEAMYRELYDIRSKQGLTPILAHIDRYLTPFNRHRIFKRLSELPVLIQANASFFLQRSTRRTALQLLERDYIHLLGSDAHDMQSRMPNLGEVGRLITEHLGEDALSRIGNYQDAVLRG